MKRRTALTKLEQSDQAVLQYSTPKRRMYGCLIACSMGIAFTAVTARYLMMGILIGVFVSTIISAFLFRRGKLSLTAACLGPLLLVCFGYTPISWFTYHGMLGSTPFLSVMFVMVITLILYNKVQIIALTAYLAMLLALIVSWVCTTGVTMETEQLASLLIAYALTIMLTIYSINTSKHKHSEVAEQITDLSMHDDLTGLLNRRAIQQVLQKQESAFAKGAADFAAVMMDVDKFKTINDQYGHDIGDSILKSTAAAIQSNIRTGDRAFRIGGDEFLLLLSQVNATIAQQICSRIETTVSKLDGYAFSVTISTGCAFRSECTSAKELLPLSDRRMYQNKRSKAQ